ncbi:MAG: hypothetical protein Q7R78_01780 [bacterium]|nr:hypothetical protein [bacterium]
MKESKKILVSILALASMIVLFTVISQSIFINGRDINYNQTAALTNYTYSAINKASSTPVLAIIPSVKIANSGDTIYFRYTYPLNATSARMFIYCPPGITVKDSINNYKYCNNWYRFNGLPATSTVIVKNPSIQPFTIVPNFYIYTAQKPNYAVGVSSQVTIKPQIRRNSCLSNGVCFDNRVFLITEGIDGNFIDSENRSIDREIVKYYSKNAQFEADFLVVFKDWDASSAVASTYSILVNNKDSGMGMFERTDSSDQYGSKGYLKSFVTMPNIKVLSFQNYPGDLGAYNANIRSFAHEMAHHWLARFTNPSLSISTSGNHYDSCTVFNNGVFADLMTNGFFNFQKTSDTTFTSPASDNNPYLGKFSNLSLYIMGLLPDTSVTPIQIVRNSTPNCPGEWNGTVYSVAGSVDRITLSDLINVYGARNPKYPNTQKNFTVQVGLLAHQNTQLTQADTDTFKRYLDEVERYLVFAFSNKASFNLIRN